MAKAFLKEFLLKRAMERWIRRWKLCEVTCASAHHHQGFSLHQPSTPYPFPLCWTTITTTTTPSPSPKHCNNIFLHKHTFLEHARRRHRHLEFGIWNLGPGVPNPRSLGISRRGEGQTGRSMSVTADGIIWGRGAGGSQM